MHIRDCRIGEGLNINPPEKNLYLESGSRMLTHVTLHHPMPSITGPSCQSKIPTPLTTFPPIPPLSTLPLYQPMLSLCLPPRAAPRGRRSCAPRCPCPWPWPTPASPRTSAPAPPRNSPDAPPRVSHSSSTLSPPGWGRPPPPRLHEKQRPRKAGQVISRRRSSLQIYPLFARQIR